jgi:fatty-acyl-CoA synthase
VSGTASGSGNYVIEFLEHCARLGDTEALVATDGRRFTYAGLRSRIIDTAAWLWEHGVRPGMTLCMLVSNPAESYFAQFGAHLLGCRAAYMTRTSPPAFLGQLITQVGSDVFVYETAVAAELGAELAGRHPSLPVLCIGSGGLGPDLTDPPAVDALPFDPTTITTAPESVFQTSGTTGAAKLVRHDDVFFRGIRQVASYYRPSDGRPIRHLLLSGTWHAGGQSGAFMTWGSGGTVIINFGLDVGVFLTSVERERATSTMMSSSMLYDILDDERLPGTDLSSLYSVTISASAATPARLRQAREVFGPALNVVYGMCEIPIMTALTDVGAEGSRPELMTSCGAVWGDARVEIRDSDGTVLAPGEIGDIWARSDVMARDYFGAPELTAKSFVDGWLRTGDAGRFDADGNLYIVDRLSDMINCGGDKVFSRPVEDALCEHPGVSQAAVIGVPDDYLGQGVYAYVVRAPGSTVEAAELRAFMVARLNDLWAPGGYEFVEALPLTEFGKVDKKSLRARHHH